MTKDEKKAFRAKAVQYAEGFTSTDEPAGALAHGMLHSLGYRSPKVVSVETHTEESRVQKLWGGGKAPVTGYHSGRTPEPGDILFVTSGTITPDEALVFLEKSDDGEWSLASEGKIVKSPVQGRTINKTQYIVGILSLDAVMPT